MNMKQVTAWVKTNWLIVVSCVVFVAAVIVGPLVGSRMMKGVQERVTKEVASDHGALGRESVEYTVPDPARPGQVLITQSFPVHEQRTERFKNLRERLQIETSRVWEDALRFNKAEHGVLVEGLFPEPSVENQRVLPGEFAKAYILRAHQALLESIGAGMPPDAQKVLLDLQTVYNSRRTQLLENQGGGELKPEQQKELTDELQARRLNKYSTRAADIALYADVSVFNLPPLPTERPSLATCWDWQVRYWIHEDIVKALARANSVGSGERGVPGAVVKRIVNVAVEDRADEQTGQRGRDPYGLGGDPYDPDPYAGERYGGAPADPYAEGAGEPAPAAAEEPGEDIAPRDFTQSVTGRFSGPGSGNKHYDVRYVNVEVVASSEHLPLFLDALSQTNFMTVVDLDLTAIDPNAHLGAGFYYGRDPVVTAKLRMETLWFREWTKALMPPEVRERRGVAAPAEAAPAPAPGGPRPAPPEDDPLEGGGG